MMLSDFANSLECSRLEDFGGLASALTPFLRRSEAAAVCATVPPGDPFRKTIQQGPFARRSLTTGIGSVIQRVAIADSNGTSAAVLFHNNYLYVSSHRLEERTLSGALVREFETAAGANSPLLAARGRHLYALGVDIILQIDLESPDRRFKAYTTWKCLAGYSASVCSLFLMGEYLVSACTSRLIGQLIGRPSCGPLQIVWQAFHRQIRRAAPVQDNVVALYTQNQVEIVELGADGGLTVCASLDLVAALPNFSAYYCDIMRLRVESDARGESDARVESDARGQSPTLVISDGRHTLLVVKDTLEIVDRIELRERIYAIAIDCDGELYAKSGSTLLQLG